ncbi:MAG TPA: hypothetical protein VHZ54_10075 [Solirubrobacterales bacterium]|nr:hypothetical protein [Solirubrobacterales bacterium]
MSMRVGLIGIAVICAVIAACSTASAAESESPEPLPPPNAETAGTEGFWDFREGVVILGFIENHGIPTRFLFKWGRTKAYGKRAYVGEGAYVYNGPEPEGPEEVEGLTGRLRPDTTYHYRLIAWNRAGKSIGQDRTFHTPRAKARH